MSLIAAGAKKHNLWHCNLRSFSTLMTLCWWQSWSVLHRPGTSWWSCDGCCLRVTSHAGSDTSSSFSCTKGRSRGQSCKCCLTGSKRGPLMTQAQGYLGTWDFGEPGHSMLGNLCHLRQVSLCQHGGRRGPEGVDVKQWDMEIIIVTICSGQDTSSVPGDVEFIYMHASKNCFSSNT